MVRRGFGEGFSDKAQRGCPAGRRLGSELPPAQHKSIAGGGLLPGARCHSAGPGCLSHATQVRQRAMPGMRTVQVAAETQKTAHTWQRRMPQRAMPGMRTVQVAAETPESAHTRKRQVRQRAMRPVQVAAKTQESAHTWQQRASAMGKRRSCDGRPHRAVQNQAFCCTGRPRRTVRCRKWPCGVREARLSIGGCARRWQQEQVRRKVRHTSGGG